MYPERRGRATRAKRRFVTAELILRGPSATGQHALRDEMPAASVQILGGLATNETLADRRRVAQLLAGRLQFNIQQRQQCVVVRKDPPASLVIATILEDLQTRRYAVLGPRQAAVS